MKLAEDRLSGFVADKYSYRQKYEIASYQLLFESRRVT
jgi:hypothetical protein